MKSLLTILGTLLFFIANAQKDVITLKNGDEIKCKVIEIGTSELKYKKTESGPLYVLKKEEIFMIKYEDGTKDVFNTIKKTVNIITEEKIIENKANYANTPRRNINSEKKIDSLHLKFGKNYIAFNLIDIAFKNFATLSYEHIFAKGNISFRIPLGITIFKWGYYNGEALTELFKSGIEMNFYPLGQGRIRYFVGPSFQIGMAEYYLESYNSNSYYPYSYSLVRKKKDMLFYIISINNGLLFQITKHFNFSTHLCLGAKHYSNDRYYQYNRVYYWPGFYVMPEFNIGYKF